MRITKDCNKIASLTVCATKVLAALLFVLVPLGLWKLVELVIWAGQKLF
jgi:hypothetical protein